MSHINESTHLELINALERMVADSDMTTAETGIPRTYGQLATRNKAAELVAMARREAKLAGLLPQDRPEVRI